MEISLLDPPAEIRPAEPSAVDALLDGKVEKISDFSTLGTMDEAMMEIVDTTNNNHYMLMVNANSALKDIEPQKLAQVDDATPMHLLYESRVLAPDEYIHPLLSGSNNTFYLLYKKGDMEKEAINVTEKFLAYEKKLSELNAELTEAKVQLLKNQQRVAELTTLLHEHKIPLPEERAILEEKKEEREKKKKEEEEAEIMKKAVMLKWTDEGPQGIKNLIAEIDKFTYTNLEVLDLSDLHMGDEGCKLLAEVFSQGWSLVNIMQFYFSLPTLPRLHSIILYGNDITKKGANILLSAFRYHPQIELLGLEVLRRRLSAKEEQIFQQMQLDSILFTTDSLVLSNLRLDGNFLVQFAAYADYLLTQDKTPTITKLFFNKNRFKSRGVMKLASLLADGKMPQLQVLDLEDNEIDEEAMLFLACAITKDTTPKLEELRLGGNSIGDKGVTTLLRYFRKNAVNSIKHLVLDRIQMEYEGIRFISNTVLFNTLTELEHLDLAGNNIQSKGFVIILKAIERGGFAKLRELDVSSNHIADDACKYMLTTLTRCQLGIVHRINLSDNSISKEMQRIILEALAGQTQLHVLFDLKRKFRWLVSFTSSVLIPEIGAGLVPKPP